MLFTPAMQKSTGYWCRIYERLFGTDGMMRSYDLVSASHC